MAIQTCMPISLLLQDTLLASTWTWLALGLATIATLIRALFTRSSPRYEPHSLLPTPADQSNVSDKENEAVLDQQNEAIKAKEMDGTTEGKEKEGSFDGLTLGSLPLDDNYTQSPPMIQPRKQQLLYIIRETECMCSSHSWLSTPSVCFEKQFGWDRVLETKLGMAWACPIDPTFGRIDWARRSMPLTEVDRCFRRSTAIAEDDHDNQRSCVVRLWSAHH